MFNNILSSFNYDIHTNYSAFYQSNLKNYEVLLNELDTYCNSICSLDLKPIKDIHNKSTNSSDEYFFLSYLNILKKKINIIPPLYVFDSELEFTDNHSESIDEFKAEKIDLLVNKIILNINSTSNFFQSIPKTDSFTSTKNKCSIWDDKIVKDLVRKRQIDVVVDLDSFVKLILCYLKELKENCYLPFLKINIKESGKNCIIFDKILMKNPNLKNEKKKYLKRCFIENYEKCIGFNKQMPIRINRFGIKENYLSTNDVLQNFINNNNQENVITQDANDSDDKLTHTYSYGIWKLSNLNVLFRFKFFEGINGNLSQSGDYIHFQINDEDTSNSETLWKLFIISTLNLYSNILKIIFNCEKNCIETTNTQSFSDFQNNTSLHEKYEIIVKIMKKFFGDILLSDKINTDFYMLKLCNETVQIYRSTSQESNKELDLRDFLEMKNV